MRIHRIRRMCRAGGLALACVLLSLSTQHVWAAGIPVAWGANFDGELGNGTYTSSTTPVQVTGLTGVASIAGGGTFTVALTGAGEVWSWGYNGDGELGNGNAPGDSDVPVQLTGLDGSSSIACGGSHALAVQSGSVWAWGLNDDGQLGNGTTTESDVPVEVSGLTTVTAVSAGVAHSLALLSNGTVWAWGRNDSGQLGNGTTTNSSVPVEVTGLTDVIAIAGGFYHSLALRSDGNVWAWGYNQDGELGDGSYFQSDVPVQITGLSGVTAISAGGFFGLALLSSGDVMSWGENNDGQLGNGTTTNSNVPVPVTGISDVTAIASGGSGLTSGHALALLTNGSVWTWGDNVYGELGNGATGNSSVPVQVTGLTGVAVIAAGALHSLAIPDVSPAVPTGVTAAAGTAKVTVSWSTSTGATSYNVYWEAPGWTSYRILTSTTAITYTLGGLTNGDSYAFDVVAVGPGGTSVASTPVTAVPVGTPSGLTVTAGGGQVALSWLASAGATAYDVFRGMSTGGESATPIADVATTSFTDTGVTFGVTYFYKVAGINGNGTSTLSKEASGSPGPAPPTVATAASATPSPVTGTTTAVSVLGASEGGESNLTYSWSATGPAAVTFSPTGTNAAQNATATFTEPGSYVLTATINDLLSQSITSSVDVTVSATPVITVTPNPVSLTPGGTQQFATTITDQFGNPLTGTVFWSTSAGAITQDGFYTAPDKSGAVWVHAWVGSSVGVANITLLNTPPIISGVAAGSNPVTGTSTTVTVTTNDLGATVSFKWSQASGPSGATFSSTTTREPTVTFTQAGTYVFNVTVSNSSDQTATGSVTVVVNPTLTITLAPSPATVPLNTVQTFTPTVVDQFGNSNAATLTWKVSGVGSTDQSGDYNSGVNPGTATITASTGSYRGTASITVPDVAPTITSLTANPNPVTSTTTTLLVLANDDAGRQSLSYQWSQTSGPAEATFSSTTVYAPKVTFSQIGTYVFGVTVTNKSGLSMPGTVTVVVNPTLTVTLTPNPATVPLGTGQTFAATVVNQFGNPNGASLTWSVTGVGSTDQSGDYSAGEKAGSATITAAADGAKGTASITVP